MMNQKKRLTRERMKIPEITHKLQVTLFKKDFTMKFLCKQS